MTPHKVWSKKQEVAFTRTYDNNFVAEYHLLKLRDRFSNASEKGCILVAYDYINFKRLLTIERKYKLLNYYIIIST